jgi:hypothetical protein
MPKVKVSVRVRHSSAVTFAPASTSAFVGPMKLNTT